jgi:hypothetical protein
MQKYWEEKWEKEKSEKSTMKFLDIKKKPIGNPHQILNLAPKTTLEVRKAEDRLGEVTRQVYWYTGAVTLWKRLLSLIMLCIMFSMSLRFSVLKILCVTMA